jgi:hypothetical protein
MNMSPLTLATASQHLSQHFRAAAGVGEREGQGLASKGLQIVDALSDVDKKIKLKGPEIERLNAYVEGLADPVAKQVARECIDLFKDRFEFDDKAAGQKLLALTADAWRGERLQVGGRVQTVSAAHATSLAETPVASRRDIDEVAAAIDATENAARGTSAPSAAAAAVVASEATGRMEQAFKDGDVKASVDDGARKAYVGVIAKKKDTSLRVLEEYASSPFFEDRLMAFLLKHGMQFITQMNEMQSNFDDPARAAALKDAYNASMKKGLAMTEQLSPQAKLRVAAQLKEFAQTNPEIGEKLVAFKDYLAQVKDMPAPGPDKKDPLEKFPSANNAVLQAMKDHPDQKVRQWGAVLQASAHAEELQRLMPRPGTELSEEDMRKMHAKAESFATVLSALKDELPEDVRKGLGDLKLDPLPAGIDPTSRQLMFQQINLMMQQYQQIMQSMSEVMNKLNEMAMTAVRKIGQ